MVEFVEVSLLFICKRNKKDGLIMGGQTFPINGASGSGGTDQWEKRINNVFWLFEQQTALDHFLNRAGQMLVDIVSNDKELENKILDRLINNDFIHEANVLQESLDAIKDIRRELARRVID